MIKQKDECTTLAMVVAWCQVCVLRHRIVSTLSMTANVNKAIMSKYNQQLQFKGNI